MGLSTVLCLALQNVDNVVIGVCGQLSSIHTRIKHNNTVSLSLHYRLSIGQMFLHVGYQG